MTGRPRIRRLLLLAALLVGVWTIFALFSSSEIYRRGLATGSSVFWGDLILVQLTSGLLWAVFTPIVIFAAERLPLQKPDRLRNCAALLLLTTVIATTRAAVGGMVLQMSFGTLPTLEFVMLSVNVRFHRNVFLILVIVGVMNLLLANRRAAARELATLTVKGDRVRAELLQLRTSVQPYFVMSTLDAIAARVKESPSAADRMLVDLGELLRTTLEYQKRGEVTMTEELELVDRYVEIQTVRSRGRFRSRVDVSDELLAAEVPPLLLQSIMESVLAGPGDGEDDWL